MNYLKQNHLSILIIVFLVISSLWGSAKSGVFGAVAADLTTVGNPWTFTNTKTPGGVTIASSTMTTLRVGATGTGVTALYKGTCSLISPTFSVAASTTVAMDCTVAGVVTADVVFGQFATSSAATGGPGWLITRASASSTAESITFSISNLTGGTAVIPASLASSTQYLIIR